jgi:hypothetical protein
LLGWRNWYKISGIEKKKRKYYFNDLKQHNSGVPNLGDAGGCQGGRQCLKKLIEIAIFAIKIAILNVFFKRKSVICVLSCIYLGKRLGTPGIINHLTMNGHLFNDNRRRFGPSYFWLQKPKYNNNNIRAPFSIEWGQL